MLVLRTKNPCKLEKDYADVYHVQYFKMENLSERDTLFLLEVETKKFGERGMARAEALEQAQEFMGKKQAKEIEWTIKAKYYKQVPEWVRENTHQLRNPIFVQTANLARYLFESGSEYKSCHFDSLALGYDFGFWVNKKENRDLVELLRKHGDPRTFKDLEQPSYNLVKKLLTAYGFNSSNGSILSQIFTNLASDNFEVRDKVLAGILDAFTTNLTNIPIIITPHYEVFDGAVKLCRSLGVDFLPQVDSYTGRFELRLDDKLPTAQNVLSRCETRYVMPEYRLDRNPVPFRFEVYADKRGEFYGLTLEDTREFTLADTTVVSSCPNYGN